ncbi:SWIM zinc finger family protein [Deinococcus malanensis]|uniref:SWIM zinc finger family protein n=1 Tax=Deinococcus malanensis TaxID=1706855 RepID=UPI003641DB35
MKLSRLPPGFALDTAAQGLALRQEAVQQIVRTWIPGGWRADGEVTDGGKTFQASVELTTPPDPQLLGSNCTCGRYRCRHVAALVLSTDPPEERRRPPQRPPCGRAPGSARLAVARKLQ